MRKILSCACIPPLFPVPPSVMTAAIFSVAGKAETGGNALLLPATPETEENERREKRREFFSRSHPSSVSVTSATGDDGGDVSSGHSPRNLVSQLLLSFYLPASVRQNRSEGGERGGGPTGGYRRRRRS